MESAKIPRVHSQQEANVYVAGIDAHTRYLVLVVLNKAGERVLGPKRVLCTRPQELLDALAGAEDVRAGSRAPRSANTLRY